MYLKNINGKRLLVLSFNISSVRKDFQIFKTFPSIKFLSQKYYLSDLEIFPVFCKPLAYLKGGNFCENKLGQKEKVQNLVVRI